MTARLPAKQRMKIPRATMPEQELAHRRRVLEACLHALSVPVEGPTAFEVDAGEAGA